MLFSIIICTHNPRLDYLKRVVRALRSQTFGYEKWEIILIDNASAQSFEQEVDLAWHPHHVFVSEGKSGKAVALCRGISEAKGKLIVVVDDDNVLAADYLEQAAKIDTRWPMLGAWSGNITAEFESPPPGWAQPYVRYLAIRDVPRDQWSNLTDPTHYSLLPWGAGMVVRREIALYWAEKTNRGRSWRQFERLGSGCGAEDTDMALTACDLGYGTGLFSSLKLTHLIRRERVEQHYLVKLVEGMLYSLRMLAASRGHALPAESIHRVVWGHLSALCKGTREFGFYRAARRGIERARIDSEKIRIMSRAARSPEAGISRASISAPKTAGP